MKLFLPVSLLLSPACLHTVLASLTSVDANISEGVNGNSRQRPRRRALRPKMVAREVLEGEDDKSNISDLPDETAEDSQTISSFTSVSMGECSPGTPFEFVLGAASGRGAIGAFCNVANSIGVSSATESHSVTIDGPPQPNFFAEEGFPQDYETSAKLCAVAIEITGNGQDGSASVTCGEKTDILVVLKDEDATDTPIDATVSCEQGNKQTVLLSNSAAANSQATLKGQTKASPKNENGKSPVKFSNASKSSITIQKNSEAKGNDSGIALVQVKQATKTGGSTYRTLITEAKSCSPGASGRRLQSIKIRSSTINEDGDIELEFEGLDKLESELGEDARFKVDARVSIATDVIQKKVHMTSMLSHDDNTMIVHGGWIRRALHSISNDDSEAFKSWDVVVEQAIISDPEDKYRVVARLNDVHATGLGSDQAHRRASITKAPTQEELDINEEMLQGRKPELDDASHRGLRALSGTHTKILVHGYCSAGSPFPGSAFTPSIAFSDPASRRRLGGSDTNANNWSNDLFAQKIDQFADENGIHGCGIIAHSQGGLASLHLYTYYWSCLDYTSTGSRLIQTVGSPYQGTNLAGNAAALGEVFGAGCGSQNDLTHSGATSWLSNIPSWAKSAVHYYTTSFTDKWWRIDYCHVATDLFLSDPDDGTVEKGRGQLSGANNRGHKTGWCHTSGMRDDDQTKDTGRNSEMNGYAKY